MAMIAKANEQNHHSNIEQRGVVQEEQALGRICLIP